MAPIEGDLALTSLTVDDIDDGMALVAGAGWNQTPADWRFMLAAGHGVGVRDEAGRVVATSVVLPYLPGIGWIGMVLVAVSHRKGGIATRLLSNAIAYCRDHHLTPMLDATPAGREVYRRLGLVDGETIERWRGTGTGAGEPNGAVDIELASRLDREAFAADRHELLADLVNRPGALLDQTGEAVLLGRPGRTATQLGPLLSPSERDAVSLCARALEATSGPLLIDVPTREAALRDLLTLRGFTVERAFTRMSLGTADVMGEAMRAIAGPELG